MEDSIPWLTGILFNLVFLVGNLLAVYINTSYPLIRPIFNYGIIEMEDHINMMLCTIILVAAVWLAWIYDQQCRRRVLKEICSELLTTIFFL